MMHLLLAAAPPLEHSVALDWTAISTAAAAIIGALAIATVSIIAAVSRARSEATLARGEVLARLDKTDQKTEEIHDAVNGASRAAAAKLEDLERKLAELREKLEGVQRERVDEANTRAKKAESRPARADGKSVE